MIVNFRDKATGDIFNGVYSKESRKIPQNIHSIAIRKLDMINAAIRIEDLRIPPGNRLESLKGELAGFFSIRINDQFRIIFTFSQSNAFNVQIVDYH
ncbi:MAG: type II toxin-antitoxin system RelE/ParE family toxin [Fibrobacterota bacterium]|nr:type II toxin-antitoxin system RelE/ParE family toxin [Chitinispirillaceae bacterium]